MKDIKFLLFIIAFAIIALCKNQIKQKIHELNFKPQNQETFIKNFKHSNDYLNFILRNSKNTNLVLNSYVPNDQDKTFTISSRQDIPNNFHFLVMKKKSFQNTCTFFRVKEIIMIISDLYIDNFKYIPSSFKLYHPIQLAFQLLYVKINYKETSKGKSLVENSVDLNLLTKENYELVDFILKYSESFINSSLTLKKDEKIFANIIKSFPLLDYISLEFYEFFDLALSQKEESILQSEKEIKQYKENPNENEEILKKYKNIDPDFLMTNFEEVKKQISIVKEMLNKKYERDFLLILQYVIQEGQFIDINSIRDIDSNSTYNTYLNLVNILYQNDSNLTKAETCFILHPFKSFIVKSYYNHGGYSSENKNIHNLLTDSLSDDMIGVKMDSTIIKNEPITYLEDINTDQDDTFLFFGQNYFKNFDRNFKTMDFSYSLFYPINLKSLLHEIEEKYKAIGQNNPDNIKYKKLIKSLNFYGTSILSNIIEGDIGLMNALRTYYSEYKEEFYSSQMFDVQLMNNKPFSPSIEKKAYSKYLELLDNQRISDKLIKKVREYYIKLNSMKDLQKREIIEKNKYDTILDYSIKNYVRNDQMKSSIIDKFSNYLYSNSKELKKRIIN